ncbi:uncharacterized protein TRIREDRAFT_110966 [Trichoderma reesei QM6a]|uniref:Predicted protein n=2 Tax=Hypocrea jecorina TaxID=51453 RepID=G0RTE7_HYPJQ|nr:uncharacterized protein TRIREDRAFT_110966 [Trichoderma reesei QM6a]EGR45625.1 predicted protein [Trichoderma reesei QM6a]ETR98746.1 hypothetical protein M419DRAFT_88080 [Trichoderma reesei RUT C-30]
MHTAAIIYKPDRTNSSVLYSVQQQLKSISQALFSKRRKKKQKRRCASNNNMQFQTYTTALWKLESLIVRASIDLHTLFLHSIPTFPISQKTPVSGALLQTGPDAQTKARKAISGPRDMGRMDTHTHTNSNPSLSLRLSESFSSLRKPRHTSPKGRSRRLSEPRGPAPDLASTHGRNVKNVYRVQLRENTDSCPVGSVSSCVIGCTQLARVNL